MTLFAFLHLAFRVRAIAACRLFLLREVQTVSLCEPAAETAAIRYADEMRAAAVLARSVAAALARNAAAAAASAHSEAAAGA